MTATILTTDSRIQVRSFPVQLEVTDQRTVEGLVVPYNTPAPITELRADGMISYREQFVRGAFERATRKGNAGRVALVYSHDETLPNRLGYGLEFRETDDGLLGTFRLDESTAAKARDVLTTSHSGLSISFLSLLPKAFTEKAGSLVTRAAAHLQHVAAVANPAYAGAGVTAIREGDLDEQPTTAEIAAQAALDEQARQLAWVDELVAADPWAAFRG
jgi:HK97 family phage prohead protease